MPADDFRHVGACVMHDRHVSPCHDGPAARIAWRDGGDTDALPRRAHAVLTSLRTGRRFQAWNAAERALVIVLDTMPQWADFRLHPAEITYWHRGVEQVARPLLWGSSGDGGRGVFYEWADEAPAPDPREAARRHDLRQQLVPHGLGLALLARAEFVSADRLAMATAIRRHALRPVDNATRERVRRALTRRTGLDFQGVLRGEFPGLCADTVCRLVFEGMLRLVPSDRLRPDTRVELNEPLN